MTSLNCFCFALAAAFMYLKLFSNYLHYFSSRKHFNSQLKGQCLTEG